MAVFQYGSFEREFDASDFEFANNYETYIKELETEAAAVSRGDGMSAYIYGYCRAVFVFFNKMFGKGSDKALFGDKTSIRECDNALFALAQAVKGDIAAVGEESQDKLSKIAQNRQARRAKSKK